MCFYYDGKVTLHGSISRSETRWYGKYLFNGVKKLEFYFRRYFFIAGYARSAVT